jgi:hypothetical protein
MARSLAGRCVSVAEAALFKAEAKVEFAKKLLDKANALYTKTTT